MPEGEADHHGVPAIPPEAMGMPLQGLAARWARHVEAGTVKAAAGGPALLPMAAPAACRDKRQVGGADPKAPPGGRSAGAMLALGGCRADDPKGREEDCHDRVRDAARAALDETRRVVGLLRAEDEHVRRPGLDRLDELIDAACGSGLRASAVVIGYPRRLEAGVELTAFRIVQESLSNAVRYAPGADVTVGLHYGPRTLTVSVTDDGARTAPGIPHGGGHGLLGIRERVALLGGTVQAGPRNGAGWSVVAELPFAAAGSRSPVLQNTP
ncbi:sensor histidine kinase [Spirillospora sp. NPDC127200]